MNMPTMSIMSPMHAATDTIIVNAVAETQHNSHGSHAVNSLLNTAIYCWRIWPVLTITITITIILLINATDVRK